MRPVVPAPATIASLLHRVSTAPEYRRKGFHSKVVLGARHVGKVTGGRETAGSRELFPGRLVEAAMTEKERTLLLLVARHLAAVLEADVTSPDEPSAEAAEIRELIESLEGSEGRRIHRL
ncbi:hypothetical protein GXW71_10490 [Roseomonas hellenica]|uniref:N-acetyltransferase domain-containing protein n=1 Tax=Plastoroseomonas hellenica TaxID=2687306 RepID=A0ABS5EX23_9PROT|nr:hypothetical protein [Plastoroseomonas hellenica]MBR0664778.1 hypothetical protein [Plastoroseomonas hellenica]